MRLSAIDSLIVSWIPKKIIELSILCIFLGYFLAENANIVVDLYVLSGLITVDGKVG